MSLSICSRMYCNIPVKGDEREEIDRGGSDGGYFREGERERGREGRREGI